MTRPQRTHLLPGRMQRVVLEVNVGVRLVLHGLFVPTAFLFPERLVKARARLDLAAWDVTFSHRERSSARVSAGLARDQRWANTRPTARIARARRPRVTRRG
jgi:hypothetical protein